MEKNYIPYKIQQDMLNDPWFQSQPQFRISVDIEDYLAQDHLIIYRLKDNLLLSICDRFVIDGKEFCFDGFNVDLIHLHYREFDRNDISREGTIHVMKANTFDPEWFIPSEAYDLTGHSKRFVDKG